MTQLWRSLLAFLFAHTQLARWLSHVFPCLCLFDESLADPGEADASHSREGRRMIESLIAGCEDWITFLFNARAAELACLRYTY